MLITDNIRALEKTVEKQVLTFFVWLGAGETPESWQQDSTEEAADSHPDQAGTERH